MKIKNNRKAEQVKFGDLHLGGQTKPIIIYANVILIASQTVHFSIERINYG